MTVKHLATSALALLVLSGAASAATLVNGSLTGTVGTGSVPAGWTVYTGSPDTNDVTNNVGGGTPFGVAPAGPSADGGTWVGLGNSSGTFAETFGQTIADFVVGATYSLSWYAGNFGAVTGPGYLGDNSIYAALDGMIVGSGASLSLGDGWYEQSITFTATSASHILSFGLTDAEYSYLSIDGIRLTEATPAVPLPASGLLLVAGIGGLGLARRRSN